MSNAKSVLLTKPTTIGNVFPEVVDFVSGQGRSDLETGGVAGLRRGFPKGENAGRERKMPFMDGH
jgi:hypothetical protein